MIHPDHWHPDYEKNIKKLEAEGYHRPRTQEELPAYLRGFCGGSTFLINDAGKVKSVSQASGEIRNVTGPKPPRRVGGPKL